MQLREKHLDDAALVRPGRPRPDGSAPAAGVPFVLNDRPDLAAAMGADGVHVGQDDMSAAAARAVVGTEAIVGLSTHASRAGAWAGCHRRCAGTDRAPAPVDYLSAGPVVPTPTKPGRPGTGPGYLPEARTRSPWPVWVTGGVDPDTRGRSGRRRCPALRGGPLARRRRRPGGAARRLRTADRRAPGRPARLIGPAAAVRRQLGPPISRRSAGVSAGGLRGRWW